MRKIIFASTAYCLLLTAYSFSQNWQWAKQIGGTGYDNAYISHIDALHNIYVYGRYAIEMGAPQLNGNNCYIGNDTLIGKNDCFIAKYDENGNLTWVLNCVSSSNGVDVAALEFDSISGFFYATGSFYQSCNIGNKTINSTTYATFLAKIDTAGNCVRLQKIADSPGSGWALAFDEDGNIFLTGTYATSIDTFTLTQGTYIAKFDSTGNCLWAKTKVVRDDPNTQPYFLFYKLKYVNNSLVAFGAVGGPYFSSTCNGSYTITVDTISRTNTCLSGSIGLLCMDENANAKWMRIDGAPYAPSNNQCMGMNKNGDIYFHTVLFSDSCIYGADTVFLNGIHKNVVVKYDSTGAIKWLNVLETNPQFSGNGKPGIHVNNDGTYLITGNFSGQVNFGNCMLTSIDSPNIFIAKFDDAGNCLGADRAGVGNGISIATDDNAVYITGVFPNYPAAFGSIDIAGNTFTTYGREDIVFAKHDAITGIQPPNRKANSSNQLLIYANPNTGKCSITVPEEFSNEENLTLRIYDNNGKLIQQQNVVMEEEKIKINLEAEAKGIYNVTLGNKKKTYSGKIVFE